MKEPHQLPFASLSYAPVIHIAVLLFLGSENGSHDSTVQHEIRIVSNLNTHFIMHTDQPFLGTTYGWYIQEQSHMRSETNASRMSNSLAVENNAVRNVLKLLKCL